MTRGNPNDLQPFDPKIYKTFNRGVKHHKNPSLHSKYSVTFPNTSETPESVHSLNT